MKDMTDLLQENGREAVRASLSENLEEVRFESDIPTVDKPRVRTVNGARIPKAVVNDAPRWKLPDMEDVCDFLEMDLPKPPELVHGLLHKGDKMVLSGSSKSYKTWILTHLAMCVAVGADWWGLKTTQGRVLYANFEVAKPFFQRRIQKIREKVDIAVSDLKGQLTVWNIKGHGADITDLANEIIERTKDKFDLIILDPIYKILGERDENSNGDIGDLMNEIDRIILETGASVIFGHHFSKGNQARKDSMDRMSGAGTFARDVETLLTITKHEDADTFVVDAVTRNHKRMEPFCVVLDDVIMERSETLDPRKLKQVNGRGIQFPMADLMKALNIQHLTRSELETQYRAATGASEGTFDKLFKKAKESNELELCEDGKKWKATSPIFPPGYNSHRSHEEEKSATVQ